MTRWTLLLALGLSTTACTDLLGSGDKGSDDDDDDGGSGSGDGGGSGGGVGGGSGGSGGGSTTCAKTFPLDETGRELEYRYNDSDGDEDFDAGWTMTYEGQDTWDGEDAWVSFNDYWSEDTELDYTSESTMRTWYRCDEEGVWPLAYEFEQIMVNAGTETEYWSSIIYAEPGLSTPKSLQAGDEWTYSYVMIISDSYGNVNEVDYSIEYTVGSQESVTVPAGTYQAWPISYESGGGTESWHVADDVGMVQSLPYELIELRD